MTALNVCRLVAQMLLHHNHSICASNQAGRTPMQCAPEGSGVQRLLRDEMDWQEYLAVHRQCHVVLKVSPH